MFFLFHVNILYISIEGTVTADLSIEKSKLFVNDSFASEFDANVASFESTFVGGMLVETLSLEIRFGSSRKSSRKSKIIWVVSRLFVLDVNGELVNIVEMFVSGTGITNACVSMFNELLN